MPRVAVVVPCFNDGETLPAALASLRGEEDHELVVVDDGSDDEATLDTLSRLLRSLVNQGVIAVAQHDITIFDRERLAEVAG